MLKFTKDLGDFYDMNPHSTLKDRDNDDVTNPSKLFLDSMEAVCNNAGYVTRNPHLLRVCCSESTSYSEAYLLNDEQHRKNKRIELCTQMHSGLIANDANETYEDGKAAHTIASVIATKACSDSDFNSGHTEVCCTAPGLFLGWSKDNENVAIKCGVARSG